MNTKSLFSVYTNTLNILVVANSFNEAEELVINYLNEKDYDWTKNRKVIKIEKIADNTVYPDDDNYKLLLIK